MNSVVMEFENNKLKYAIDINYDEGVFVASILGRTDSARRMLRNALIGQFEMAKSNGERHFLGTLETSIVHSESSITRCHDWLVYTRDLIESQVLSSQRGGFVQSNCINAIWWDKKANFGDAVGPWLISKISHKNPVNGKGLQLSSPPIMSVGSIFNLLDQDDSIVWGTGLMGPLSDEAARKLRAIKNVSVLAVRGKLTREEIVLKLGWDVPEIYGDPALLLPRFLPLPKAESDTGSIAVVPHYLHMDHFKQLESESVHVLDVKDGMERVVRQIAAARVCVSTSLHGLIVAQAYGVPWVWVRVGDRKLGGDTFKFRDFFSTLDDSAVRAIDVAVADIGNLDMETIAETASLPELRISLDDLLQSLPLGSSSAESEQEGLSAVLQGGGAREESKDLSVRMENLVRKMDTISAELGEQRRLLEELVGMR